MARSMLTLLTRVSTLMVVRLRPAPGHTGLWKEQYVPLFGDRTLLQQTLDGEAAQGAGDEGGKRLLTAAGASGQCCPARWCKGAIEATGQSK